MWRGGGFAGVWRGGGLAGTLREVFDSIEEYLGLDWLSDIGVHTGLQTALAVANHGMGGHGDDGNVATGSAFLLADGGSGFESAHLGHLHVHENEIELLFFERGEGQQPVGGNGDFVAALLQKADGNLLVDGLILGEENAQTSYR